VVAILASLVAFVDASVVNLALPAIARDLGGGLALQQWIVDSYLLSLGALILVAGSISDAFGRVRVLRCGLVVFGLGTVLAAAAPSGWVLIAARLVQGLGAAFLVPTSLALINSTYRAEDQPRTIGIWTAWTGTAFVLGPVVGGLSVDLFSWRWIFILSAVPVVLTFALSVGLGVGQQPHRRARIDVPGAVLAAVGLGGAVFGFIELPRLGPSAVAVPLAFALAALVGFLWWQRRAAHPMVPLGLFGIRNFGFGNLATAFVYAGLSLGMLILALFLQEVAGFTATAAGVATLPLPVLSFLLAARVGVLAARFGPHLFMALGPVVAAAGFALMRPVAGAFDFWVQLLPGLLLFALGLAITVTPLTSAILAAVDATQSGIASAINNAVSRIAGLVAIALVGLIASGTLDFDGFRRLATVTAALLLAGGLVSAVGIRNPRRSRSVTPMQYAPCRDRITAPPGG
jgi:EmrB/QacA subfamily drug resistance transporter